MLTEEQTSEIKKQLIENIGQNFPEDKREFAISQIESMNSENLEEFLNKNNLQVQDGSTVAGGGCIFCSIASGSAQSYPIGENEEAIAVLEINPVSKGHTIIIPKLHGEDWEKEPSSEKIKELIKEVSEKIKTNLNPKEVTTENSSFFGHQIINLIPQYEGVLVSLKSEKHTSKPEELAEIQKLLEKQELPKEEKKEEPKEKEKPKIPELNEKNTWLPKRIP